MLVVLTNRNGSRRKSRGLGERNRAAGPAPSPLTPWQDAQSRSNSRAPVSAAGSTAWAAAGDGLSSGKATSLAPFPPPPGDNGAGSEAPQPIPAVRLTERRSNQFKGGLRPHRGFRAPATPARREATGEEVSGRGSVGSSPPASRSTRPLGDVGRVRPLDETRSAPASRSLARRLASGPSISLPTLNSRLTRRIRRGRVPGVGFRRCRAVGVERTSKFAGPLAGDSIEANNEPQGPNVQSSMERSPASRANFRGVSSRARVAGRLPHHLAQPRPRTDVSLPR